MEYDPLQLEMMKEELIVVDYDDNPIGQDSKKTCASDTSSIFSLHTCAELMSLSALYGRPSNEQHPTASFTSTPRLQRIPLQTFRRPTTNAKTRE
jgi:hypothetical protein